MWAKIIAALLGAWIGVVALIGLHLSRRLERVERWQLHHAAPLERLALEQDAAEDPARAAAVRSPHRGGSRASPI